MYNLFMSAPITNNGYYDIPIDNQYSNTDYARNNASYTRNVNKDLQNKINNNRENYIMLNQKTIPDRTLFYEDNTKKNEDTEYFSNSSNTNYSYINNDQKLLSNGMRDYGIVNYHTLEYPQQFYNDINDNHHNDNNDININKKINNNLLINKFNKDEKINKLDKPYKRELILSNKENKIENKKIIKKISKKKKESDNNFFNKKTLWNIIYGMFIIILLLIIKILYDNKIITIK